jgi:beta-phosphoglucomutase-like phosphatase (HAD superfamily)
VPLRAIVFDFDGVIANSEPLHFRAFRDVLARRGIELSEQDYYGRYLGFDDAGVFRAVAERDHQNWDPGTIAALVTAKAVEIEALERDTSILFPGAADAVRRAADAVPLAIASGALDREIRRVLEREGLISFFQTIVAAESTRFSKPSPDPYLLAVSQLSRAVGATFSASDVVGIEDSAWGLQSAHAAGLRTVGVAHTYAPETLEADLVIESIDELDIGALVRMCSY